MLELSHISKRFGRPPRHVVALDDVSLAMTPGRVHGLLGENGAGKSTLMNVLAGLVRPDAGTIALDGQPRVIRAPADSQKLGVGMVHQHFKLVEPLTVAENVAIGLPGVGLGLRPRQLRARIAEAAERFSIRLDPDRRVADLSVGQRQRVEVLKVLMRGVRFLILDEPTAVLTPQEVDELFAVIRQARVSGASVVLITHRLAEVPAVCDEITVLRHGRMTHRGPVDATVTPASLTRWMVGQEVAVARSVLGLPKLKHRAVLSVRDLTVRDLAGTATSRLTVSGVCFDVYPGELLGIAGVDGNGQRELCEALIGIRPAGGRVLMDDLDISQHTPAARFALGLASIPDDRQREALVLGMSVAENLALKLHGRRPWSVRGWLRTFAWRAHARTAISRFNIRADGPATPVGHLSGGNQQKVVLARELGLSDAEGALPSPAPRVVVAMNPVRGLDVQASAFVYQQLLLLREQGSAVVVIAGDLDELLTHADRLAVMHAGELTMTTFPAADRETIGRLMLGEREAKTSNDVVMQSRTHAV